jgi:hypothetical protein
VDPQHRADSRFKTTEQGCRFCGSRVTGGRQITRLSCLYAAETAEMISETRMFGVSTRLVEVGQWLIVCGQLSPIGMARLNTLTKVLARFPKTVDQKATSGISDLRQIQNPHTIVSGVLSSRSFYQRRRTVFRRI